MPRRVCAYARIPAFWRGKYYKKENLMKTNNSRFCFGIAVYAALAALCAALILTACPTGGGGDGTGVVNTEAASMIYTGKDTANKDIVVTITHSARAVTAFQPKNGDLYTVTRDGASLDEGTIAVSGTMITFTSSQGNASFTIVKSGSAYKVGGTGKIAGYSVGTLTRNDGSSGGSGINSGIWSQLLGTWRTADGKLEYKFTSSPEKMVIINGDPPYEQWIDFFFFASTVTSNTIAGETASFTFTLSGSTLTVSDFRLLEAKADVQPGPVNFNGTLSKQP
jgi:hypothetical protein